MDEAECGNVEFESSIVVCANEAFEIFGSKPKKHGKYSAPLWLGKRPAKAITIFPPSP
jgi:hypothetical protein